MDRIQTITKYLSKEAYDVMHEAVVVADEAWDGDPVGWDEPTEDLEVRFCPSRIADVTHYLDNENFTAYLDIITWIWANQIALNKLPKPERDKRILTRLADEAPTSLVLARQVEVRWNARWN